MKYALPLTLPLALALAACNKPAEAPAADTAAPPTSAQAEASDNSATAPEATPSVAAETTHQLDKVQATVFDAMHNSRSLTPNASQEQILDYLGKKGVDTQAMSAAMSSFSMSSRLSQGLQFANRSGVEGTPTLIVNGKYRVLGRTHEDQLQVVNTLIAQERAATAAQ